MALYSIVQHTIGTLMIKIMARVRGVLIRIVLVGSFAIREIVPSTSSVVSVSTSFVKLEIWSVSEEN